jgi:acetyl esterase/lipase
VLNPRHLVAIVVVSTGLGMLTVGSSASGMPSEATQTVAYCQDGGVALHMTLFAPASIEPPPVVLEVHGGGWEGGNRFDSLGQSVIATQLVQDGFAVASIDYRTAPTHPWPDAMIDVSCAVRYLRAEGSALGINAERIVAWGDSAGGQLVSLLGTANLARYDNGQYAQESSQVQAVVDEFGPADLSATGLPQFTTGLITKEFGHDPSVLAEASPTTQVGLGDPPFLILQGTADVVVPASQSSGLARRLRQDKDRTELVLVRGGDHGLLNGNEHPGPAAIGDTIEQFVSSMLH